MNNITDSLEQLRRKLIDLSNRNPLIKYNLTVTSRPLRHINIVDNGIENIWELLRSEEELELSILPESKMVRGDKSNPSILEIAKELQINPSLELPLSINAQRREKFLQTLLLFDRYRSTVSNIYEKARLAREEKGIECLYCVFGFLEWQESPNSELFLTSPLILVPIELGAFSARTGANGSNLRGSEIEPGSSLVNPALALKLKNDFGIELPKWEDNDSPSSYFKRVQDVIKVYPKWRILNRAVIDNFAFPKLALYEDLNPSHWGNELNNLLTGHPLISQLFGGSDRSISNTEQTREFDEVVLRKPVEGIVCNADSSQLEAIHRITAGENMIIEGPPGTGKSQTIANLISVAIAQGKSVLFVAEKKVAIQVVEGRLAKAGLGPFCLNLHDCSSSGKEEMYARLEERLQHGTITHNRKTENLLRDTNSNKLCITAEKLDTHFRLLADSCNPEQPSTADILWSSISSRKKFEGLKPFLQKIRIPSPLNISKEEEQEATELLKRLEHYTIELGLENKGVSSHPLFALKGTDLNLTSKEQIVEDLARLQAIVAELSNLSQQLASHGLMTEQTPNNIETLSLLVDTYGPHTDYALQKAITTCEYLPELTNTIKTLEIFSSNSGNINLDETLNNELSSDGWKQVYLKISIANKIYTELQAVFLDKVFEDSKNIDYLAQILLQESPLARLKPSWWRGRSELANLTSKQPSLKHAERMQHLKLFQKFLTLHQEIITHPNLKALIPSFDKSENDFVFLNKLETLSNLFQNVKKKISEDPTLSNRSIQNILRSLHTHSKAEKIESQKAKSIFIDRLASCEPEQLNLLHSCLGLLKPLLHDLTSTWTSFQKVTELDAPQFLGHSISIQSLFETSKCLSLLSDNLGKLSDWTKFQKSLSLVSSNSLISNLIEAYIRNDHPLPRVTETFNILLDHSRALEAFSQHRLSLCSGDDVQALRQRFEREDDTWMKTSREYVKKVALSRTIDQGTCKGLRREWTGLELIRNELAKKQRRISPRQLINRARNALNGLTPCFMMSPTTIAQLLAPSGPKFDLVLIDEASQMRPEDAISAVVRGSQLVVVGDSKQLPPSNFYTSIIEDEAVSDEDAIDNESILDMAKATFSGHTLRWHYRSRHQSLILFSNQNFYDGRLIVCPSPRPISHANGLHLVSVKGTYKDSCNHIEAKELVAKAVELLKTQPTMTLGIVAMNIPQRDLIVELLNEAQQCDSAVVAALEALELRQERCFVKNLENVQGDERDIILISTVYGPSQIGGTVMRNFGPINGATGDRRLNVLFSRSRESMYVFSSLKPSDVCPPNVKTSRGAEVLARFLEYAGSGIDGAASPKVTSITGPDSPFEKHVGDILEQAGYQIEYQVGQSGFRIDIGVKHSSFPYGFLAGIECDGATYHSSKSARDRDRLRQDILEGHGWHIYRIWSTDWFNDPTHEASKLIAWMERRCSKMAGGFNNKPLQLSVVEHAERLPLRTIEQT